MTPKAAEGEVANDGSRPRSRSELTDLLGAQEDLSSHEMLALARRIEELDDAPDVRIAYVGNTTFSSLPSFTAVSCLRRGILIENRVGPFGQYMREVLDRDRLPSYDPDVVLFLLSPRALFEEESARMAGMTADDRKGLLDRIRQEVDDWVSAARANLSGAILIANFPPPPFPTFGTADMNQELGESELYWQLNLDLLRAFRSDPRVHLVDLWGLLKWFGERYARDERMWRLARMPWRDSFLEVLAEHLSRYLVALGGRASKCLVLDLDNTLWGGVLGEEGPDGIKVGTGDPESEAYLEAQREILNLRDRGVILAIASRNNPADVEEVFRRRTEMPLTLEDFAAVEIHWEPKHLSLERIAERLNIGRDSLVFVDDNAAEIELIRQMLPGVQTVLVPEERSAFAASLRRMPWFDRIDILEEDRAKAGQYRAQNEREKARVDAPDFREYLESLEMRLRIRTADPADLPRLHQLFSKTNQFNVTTHRYGLGELEALLEDPDSTLVVAEASDRFGDLGKIGAYLLRRLPDGVAIDSFLLSCRAMGRGIETAMMNDLKQRVLESGRDGAIRSAYRPTRKNAPVRTFYEDQGFTVRSRTAEGEKEYELDGAAVSPLECGWIEVVS